MSDPFDPTSPTIGRDLIASLTILVQGIDTKVDEIKEEVTTHNTMLQKLVGDDQSGGTIKEIKDDLENHDQRISRNSHVIWVFIGIGIFLGWAGLEGVRWLVAK